MNVRPAAGPADGDRRPRSAPDEGRSSGRAGGRDTANAVGADGTAGADEDVEKSADTDTDTDADANANTDAEDPRTVRARSEPMAVHPLRDDTYRVETAGGAYTVDLRGGRCGCPDHRRRGARCKHLRRVAMEVAAGRVPGPDERVGACGVCGRDLFVPARATGAFLCRRHRPRPGAFARDRETGDLLVVTRVRTDRADDHETREGRSVASYDSNEGYGDHEPVVEAVYVGEDLGDGDEGEADRERDRDADRVLDVASRRRYAFPASRLRELAPAERPEVPVVGIGGPDAPTDGRDGERVRIREPESTASGR